MAGDPAHAATEQVWQPGSLVQLATTFGDDLIGEVFSYDARSHLLVLKTSGGGPHQTNLRMIRSQFIVESQVLSEPDPEYDLRLPYIDDQKCQQREDKAIAVRRQEAAKIGVGVSPEAQAIFLALAKTMTCKWEGTTIIVLDEVTVSPPYGSSDCTAMSPNDERAVARVRLVLKEERARLGLANGAL